MLHVVGGEPSLKMSASYLLRFGCNDVLKVWRKRISFAVVHGYKGIFFSRDVSLRQRNFLSLQWFTATKELSFVTVVHCNKEIKKNPKKTVCGNNKKRIKKKTKK